MVEFLFSVVQGFADPLKYTGKSGRTVTVCIGLADSGGASIWVGLGSLPCFDPSSLLPATWR